MVKGPIDLQKRDVKGGCQNGKNGEKQRQVVRESKPRWEKKGVFDHDLTKPAMRDERIMALKKRTGTGDNWGGGSKAQSSNRIETTKRPGHRAEKGNQKKIQFVEP